jgi:hypothetical protein
VPGEDLDPEVLTMPYTATDALAWVNKYIRKPATYRNYAVLDLVSFMGITDSLSDPEFYETYALLLYYNSLPASKQDSYGKKYDTPLKFSYSDGAASTRNKDDKPTVDAKADKLTHKNVELAGCGQCAYFAERARLQLAIPQLMGKPAPPKVEQVALSNHNLVRVNGDATQVNHVIVDLWLVALGLPVASSICAWSDWYLKGQAISEGGLKVTNTFNPVTKAWT